MSPLGLYDNRSRVLLPATIQNFNKNYNWGDHNQTHACFGLWPGTIVLTLLKTEKNVAYDLIRSYENRIR